MTGQSGDVRLEVNRWVVRCFLKLFRVEYCRICSVGHRDINFHAAAADCRVRECLPKSVCIVGNRQYISG